MVVQAGLYLRRYEFPEPQHHADLVGLDAVEAGKAPEHERDQDDQGDAAPAEIARQHVAQPVLAAAEEFFQIGRPRSAARWLRS